VVNIAGNVLVLMRENYLQLKTLVLKICQRLRGQRKVKKEGAAGDKLEEVKV
jgi:hypothetical protein